MVIISGTKAERKRIGWIADFCQNCLEIRAFELLAHGIGDHLFFVGLGLKTTHGHMRKCSSCHLPVNTGLSRYQSVPKKRPADLEDLIKQTFPALRRQEHEWLKVAAQLNQNKNALSPEQRSDRMVEVLQAFNPLVEQRYSNWSDFDRESGSGCLITLLIVFVCINRGCAAMDNRPLVDWWWKWAFDALIAGLVVTLGLSIFGPSRFLRREVIPGVALGLLPLRPTTADVENALSRTRSLQLKIGRKIKVARLTAELASLQKPAFPI
jgi:hypothetical protein